LKKSANNALTARAVLLLAVCALAACSSTEPRPRVAGTMRFRLGGTSGAAAILGNASIQSAPLVVGTDYITSPNKAKITFTSVLFRDAKGETLGTSAFTDCAVTYDRSLQSGATLLDCPFTIPVGEISQMVVYFDKTIQILVSDATNGIYSDPSVASKFSASAPAGGAAFVTFTITIGDNNPSRGTPIIFASPLAIAEGSTPTLYVTTDMIHNVPLRVNADGTTLTANPGADPVALFGGLTPGSSMYYGTSTTIESVKSQGTYIRVFTDQAGSPLYLIGTTCGVDGPKGAWASPPIGATIGGWLGKDGANVIAWALPTDSTYVAYSAYFTMPERTVIGQTTTVSCKATTSPPAPADGKTYSSGAPAMTGATTSTIVRLLAK
jgi:hypothetical protein